ncbi:MAG: MBL fold metallo-hydrolase [Acidobacteria bacterium]|nr:MBL fold metallo-hydrolase [Acidobacteriota bacterium]
MRTLKVLVAVVLVLALAAGVLYWLRRKHSQTPLPTATPSAPFVTQGRLQIYALDVGQGDSLLIISPTGKTVLIDGGNVQAGEAVIAALQRHGVKTIDLAVASHPHADHIGGLRRVLERVPVKNLLDSGQSFASTEYERLLRVTRDKRIKLINAKRGLNFDLEAGVRLDAFHPQGDGKWLTDVRSGGSVENANSVVLRLSYGAFSMLFTGDAEAETEAALLKARFPLQAQVLKVGHHGSRYATSGRFLETVAPQTAVISCGNDNRYAHPAQATLDRLRKARIAVFRTDLSGELAIISDGKQFDVFPTRATDLAALWLGRMGVDEMALVLPKGARKTEQERD